MVLKNLTTGKTITSDLKEAKSFTDLLFGILKPSNPAFMLFRTRFGIHTFFIPKPISVLVLDKDNRVVQVKNGLKPNRVFFWNPIYSVIIEAPLKANLGISHLDILDYK